MKKIFYFISAAALLFGGCTESVFEEVAVDTELSGTRTLTINTEIEAPEGTRALWNYTTGFAWETGNKLKVVGIKAYNSEAVVIDESNPGKGSFEVKNVGADETTFNAYMSRGNISYANGKVTFTVPATREMTISSERYSLNVDYVLLASKGEFTIDPDENTVSNVPFKFVTPLVCFRVYGDVSNAQIKSVAITANDNAVLGGNVVAYTLSDGTCTVTENPTSSVGATVTNVASVTKTKDDSKYVFLSVLPSKTTNVTYTVTICDKDDTSNETTYRFTSDKGQEFKENTIYTLPLNLANADKSEGVEISGVKVEDGGDVAPYKYYLGKTVTVAGKNLDQVKEVKIGENAIDEVNKSYGSLSFAIPEDLDFGANNPQEETAKEFTLTIDEYTEQIKVYPFYFYPNVTIGAQAALNRDKAFFVPDLGRVISTDEFAKFDGENCFDPYIEDGVESERKNKVNTGMVSQDAYYSVLPYIFVTNNGIQGAANSKAQINKFSDSNKESLPTGYGTPLVSYRPLNRSDSDSKEKKSVAAFYDDNGSLLEENTLESVELFMPRTGNSGAPAYVAGNTTTTSQFTNGTLLLVNHLAYDGVFNNNNLVHVYKAGLMLIKNVATTNDALANDSTITFDFYWTKPLREK